MSAPIDGNQTLEQADPEVHDLVEREKHRQWKGLELIASEVPHMLLIVKEFRLQCSYRLWDTLTLIIHMTFGLQSPAI